MVQQKKLTVASLLALAETNLKTAGSADKDIMESLKKSLLAALEALKKAEVVMTQKLIGNLAQEFVPEKVAYLQDLAASLEDLKKQTELEPES